MDKNALQEKQYHEYRTFCILDRLGLLREDQEEYYKQLIEIFENNSVIKTDVKDSIETKRILQGIAKEKNHGYWKKRGRDK